MNTIKKNKVYLGGIVLLSSYLFLAVDDLIDDINDDMPAIHIYANTLFVVVGILSLLYYSIILYRELKVELEKRNMMMNDALLETLKFKDEITALKKGIVDNINRQFKEWSLTDAEKEISFLLLKGFSFKEIASLRNTSEKTVRDQATKIYSKSSVTNRAEFAASFLEDLLS